MKILENSLEIDIYCRRRQNEYCVIGVISTLISLGLVKLKKIHIQGFPSLSPPSGKGNFFLTTTIGITYESFSNVNELAIFD